MRQLPVEIASVVVSKAGRDEGRTFLVMSEVDEDFVMVTDGGLRGVDRQKKKRRKHLKPTGRVIDELKERLEAGKPVENHEVREWIAWQNKEDG